MSEIDDLRAERDAPMEQDAEFDFDHLVEATGELQRVRAERDALAAVIEEARAYLDDPQPKSTLRHILSRAPQHVLAEHDNRVRLEALDNLAGMSDQAAMDLWRVACDDGWAVPDDLPKKFLKHAVWAEKKYIARVDRELPEPGGSE